MSETTAVARPAEYAVEPHPWGRLVWMVSGARGNSTTMTVGRCHIRPGMANPRHHHPNCDEVLYLVRGRLEHSIGDERIPMGPGDVVSIPRGAVHNARNVGEEEAEMVITFSTPDRETVGE